MSILMSLRTPRSLVLPFMLGLSALAGASAVAHAARTPPAEEPPPPAPESAGTITFEGEDDDATFEIESFSSGVQTEIGSATGGAGAGKIKFNEFTIKKTTDKASPSFFKNCALGAHYGKVIIEMRKSGGDPNSAADDPISSFVYENVFTTKIDWSGPGDEGPEESITFVYGKMGVKYIDPDGAVTDSGIYDSETATFM